MVREEVNVETDAPTKLNNEAPTDITSPPAHGELTELHDEDNTWHAFGIVP